MTRYSVAPRPSTASAVLGIAAVAGVVAFTASCGGPNEQQRLASWSQAVSAATTNGKKITICHIPPGNPANAHTITIGIPAVEAHRDNHGDTVGACGDATGGGGEDGSDPGGAPGGGETGGTPGGGETGGDPSGDPGAGEEGGGTGGTTTPPPSGGGEGAPCTQSSSCGDGLICVDAAASACQGSGCTCQLPVQ